MFLINHVSDLFSERSFSLTPLNFSNLKVLDPMARDPLTLRSNPEGPDDLTKKQLQYIKVLINFVLLNE